MNHFLWMGFSLGILFSFGIEISETHILLKVFEPLAAELQIPQWGMIKQYLIISDLLITLVLILAAYLLKGTTGIIGVFFIVAGGFLLPFSGSYTIIGVILFLVGAATLKAG